MATSSMLSNSHTNSAHVLDRKPRDNADSGKLRSGYDDSAKPKSGHSTSSQTKEQRGVLNNLDTSSMPDALTTVTRSAYVTQNWRLSSKDNPLHNGDGVHSSVHPGVGVSNCVRSSDYRRTKTDIDRSGQTAARLSSPPHRYLGGYDIYMCKLARIIKAVRRYLMPS